MNGADVAKGRGLAGEKQFVIDRLGQDVLRRESVDRSVAVSAAGKWVVVPVVKVSRFQLPADLHERQVEDASERIECLVENVARRRRRASSNAIGLRSPDPANQKRSS